jgi:hypothetical protein
LSHGGLGVDRKSDARDFEESSPGYTFLHRGGRPAVLPDSYLTLKYYYGQRAPGPGDLETEQPASTSGPGGLETKLPDNATETTLATTTTPTSTFSSTKGGLHISTTITNTTTIIPVQP